MASKPQTSVTLFGSPPWGFRISGGKEFNQPLVVSRVTPGSVAAKGGLASGDVILVVNGEAVVEMTQDECEAKVKQAVGSLYLVLEKNAATVSVESSGDVTVEGNRNVYNDESDVLRRMERHNRSAKPFPGSFTAAPPVQPPPTEDQSNNPVKPSGFRSVTFRPKTNSSDPSPKRSQPDGQPAPGSGFNSTPKQFVPSS